MIFYAKKIVGTNEKQCIVNGYDAERSKSENE